MIKKLKTQKYRGLQMIATIAITIATQALVNNSNCTLLVYEPKLPEALKQEMK